jgi:hypothetical protein
MHGIKQVRCFYITRFARKCNIEVSPPSVVPCQRTWGTHPRPLNPMPHPRHSGRAGWLQDHRPAGCWNVANASNHASSSTTSHPQNPAKRPWSGLTCPGPTAHQWAVPRAKGVIHATRAPDLGLSARPIPDSDSGPPSHSLGRSQFSSTLRAHPANGHPHRSPVHSSFHQTQPNLTIPFHETPTSDRTTVRFWTSPGRRLHVAHHLIRLACSSWRSQCQLHLPTATSCLASGDPPTAKKTRREPHIAATTITHPQHLRFLSPPDIIVITCTNIDGP